jgi:hypothetical protein
MKNLEAAINNRGFLGIIIVTYSLLQQAWLKISSWPTGDCSDAASVSNDISGHVVGTKCAPGAFDMRGKI